MQFNLREEIEKDRTEGRSIVASIVLGGMGDAVAEVAGIYKENDGVIDVTLTVEGNEIDVKAFCDHWQSQVRWMIKEQAKKITDELFSFNEIDDLLYDLKDRLQSEVNKRLEDWEKEVDLD